MAILAWPNHLWVQVLGEQERGVRMPEVVEAYLREPRLLQERLERATGEVVAVEGCCYGATTVDWRGAGGWV
jgi:hypothetical protein